MNQYFTENPDLPVRERELTLEIFDSKLRFITNGGLFSCDEIDYASLLLIKNMPLVSGSLLDLGCGYGVVGIFAAKIVGAQNVVMSDIDKNSIEFSTKNAANNNVGGVKIILSDGFKSIDDTDFTHILSNPPYHADFSVPKHFIEKGFNRLAIGGCMYMVTKRKDWYKNKLAAIFGGVKIFETDGYFVFRAEKRGMKYSNTP